MPHWAQAFLAALLFATLATPLLRRLALTTDFVDNPGDRKSHSSAIPYLGGVALIGGTLLGLSFASRLPPRAGAIAFGAAVLGAVGLIDDDRTVELSYRFAAELVTAAGAVALGLRIHATGVAAMDVVLTVLWVVGVTNALNLLDNMDGLAAGVAGTAGIAVLTLALFGQQPLVAAVAAALAGACGGFLAYNRPPASIFMGDAGSLFLGFILAILTVDVAPDVTPPVSFAIPLMLMALPVLDTSTVTISRLRRGRSVLLGGKDHLSHRLVRRGLSKRASVAVLIGVQAVLGALAVVAGRRLLPLEAVLLATAGVLAAVVAATAPVDVYEESVAGFPRRLRLVAAGVAVAVPLMAAPAVVALVRAKAPAEAAAESAKAALVALRAGDTDKTAAEFREAEASFALARRRLNGPLISLGLAVPGLSSNLHAARTVVDMGQGLSRTGAKISSVSEAKRLQFQGGALPLDELERLAPLLAEAAIVLRESQAKLTEVERAFLVPSVRDAVADLHFSVSRERLTAERAAESARLLPAMLGGDGGRRYFIAFQNNTELRGAGGFIGNWGELAANGGRLRLARFGRLQELNSAAVNPVLDMPAEFQERWRDFNVASQWQQVNVSPDFPTTARVVSSLYPQSGGAPVDGVIAVDPQGLAAFLELTGPVPVPGWPEPIGAHNVVDVTLRAAYERFTDQEERVEFLGDVARRVSEAFTEAQIGNPPGIVSVLGKAVKGRHLQVYMNRPEQQALMTKLGLDGAVLPPRGDSLLIVNQNVAANKADFYLHRTMRYRVQIDPGGETADVTGRLELGLDNRAPSRGLPEGVIGPYDQRFAPGENRTYVSMYSPFATRSATLEGRPVDPQSHSDLGHQSESMVVSIPSKETRTLVFDLRGRVRLSDDGWYRLDLLHQPSVVPDEMDLSIQLPSGWKVAETRGIQAEGPRTAASHLTLDQARTVWVRIEPTGWSRLRERIFDS